MKVLKFGGTSVGSVNSILSVKKIVEAIDEPVIVIVSALGGNGQPGTFVKISFEWR
jgi:aspartokinase/homoserine dehydrogenase 1